MITLCAVIPSFFCVTRILYDPVWPSLYILWSDVFSIFNIGGFTTTVFSSCAGSVLSLCTIAVFFIAPSILFSNNTLYMISIESLSPRSFPVSTTKFPSLASILHSSVISCLLYMTWISEIFIPSFSNSSVTIIFFAFTPSFPCVIWSL